MYHLFVTNFFMHWKINIMKKILVILTCFSFFLQLKAQENDSSVIFNAGFIKHELQNYEMSLSNFTINNGDTTTLETLKAKVDVYITDSTESFYLIRWKIKDFTINTNSRQLSEIISLAKPVTLTFRVTKHGIIEEFISWEETSKCLDEGLKVVLKRFSTRSDSVALLEVKRIFAFRGTFEAMFPRTINMFHQIYGLGYNVNEEVDVPVEVYGLVSTPVRGLTRKKLTGIDKNNGFAMLSMATFPDRSDLKENFLKQNPGLTIPSSLLNQTILGGVMVDLKTSWIIYTFEQRERTLEQLVFGELLEMKHIDN